MPIEVESEIPDSLKILVEELAQALENYTELPDDASSRRLERACVKLDELKSYLGSVSHPATGDSRNIRLTVENEVAFEKALSDVQQSSRRRIITIKGELDLLDAITLSLLIDGPRNGYQLQKILLSDYQTRVSFGTLYPRLHRLEVTNLVTISRKANHPKGVFYELTQSGRETLWDNVRSFKGKLEKVSKQLEKLENC